MTIENEKTYLAQLILPFLVLGFVKHSYFYIGAVVIVLILPFSGARKLIINSWIGLGHFLQKLVSPIVIGSIYFVVLTPLAVIRRIFTKDSSLRLTKPQNSNFQDFIEENNEEQYKELW